MFQSCQLLKLAIAGKQIFFLSHVFFFVCFPFSFFYHSTWRATLPPTPPPFRLFTADVMFAKGSPIRLQSEGLDPMARRGGHRWGPGSAALGARSFPIRPHARGYLCSFGLSVLVAGPEKGIIIKESKREKDTWEGRLSPPAGSICLKQIHHLPDQLPAVHKDLSILSS